MGNNPSVFGSGGGLQPWQFQPEAFAAGISTKKLAADITTTATSTIYGSPTVANDPNAVGKTIMVNGGNAATGAGATPVIATITSTSPSLNQFQTNVAAGITAAAPCVAIWGPDATAAVQGAINAGNAYALANNYQSEVLGSGIYMLNSPPVQATSPFTQNAQLQVVPSNIALNGQARKGLTVLRYSGISDSGQTQYWESVFPNMQGFCLVSTRTAPSTADPTFGQQAVLGGPSGGGAFTGGFANWKVHLDGVTVWFPIMTNLYPYDFGFMSQMSWESFSAQAFAPAANLSGASVAHPYMSDVPSVLTNIGVGCRFPLVGNNDDVNGRSYAVQGIDLGANFGDHFSCQRMVTVYVDSGARLELVNGISNLAHLVQIGNWSIEQYNGGLTTNGGGGSFAAIDISMDSETIGGAAAPTYDVNDGSNILTGVLRLTDAGGRTVRQPVLTGAGGLRVVNDLQRRGVMASPPAVPTSGVATPWLQRDAIITMSTGVGVTVSAIAIRGVVTGLTMAASSTLVLPEICCNDTWTVTYAGGTPTISVRLL